MRHTLDCKGLAAPGEPVAEADMPFSSSENVDLDPAPSNKSNDSEPGVSTELDFLCWMFLESGGGLNTENPDIFARFRHLANPGPSIMSTNLGSDRNL